MTQTDPVARYYDANTRAFVRWGQGGRALHRAVWGPGVADRGGAFDWIHERLLIELQGAVAAGGTAPSTVLDLGCGTGATLEALLGRGVGRGVGITNSRVQWEEARRRCGALFGSRIEILFGDFCRVTWDGAADLVVAVESFVHASDARVFFDRAAGWLRPEGRLVLCDDVMAEGAQLGDRAVERWIREVRAGWHMSSLLTRGEIGCLAEAADLEPLCDEDLTPWLELDRPRDRLLAATMDAARLVGLSSLPVHPRWLAWRGGDALRRCLESRALTYRLMVWRRR